MTWSLMRVEPVSAQMAGPSAAALIKSGVCATGYAVRVPGTTTVSWEPVIHRRPGRRAKLLAPGYRHVGPPAAAPAGGPARCGAGPRTTGSRTARAIGRKAL